MSSENSFLLDKNYFNEKSNFYDVSLGDGVHQLKHDFQYEKVVPLGLQWSQVSFKTSKKVLCMIQ